MSLAFLIPFSQGWNQASIAAITIMLIAAMGSLNDSILKGVMRVLGTIIGAIIGMTLIALFPQDRFTYLLLLSLFVSLFLYLVRAYKGDPSIFMLSAMTMMMVFDNGSVDDVFLYGVDKVYMSIFGITLYTLVGIFLWPVSSEDTGVKDAQSLSTLQEKLFTSRGSETSTFHALLNDAIKQENTLENAFIDINATSIDTSEWQSIVASYKKLNTLLSLEVNHTKQYTRYEDEIVQLFQNINSAWTTKQTITIPKEMHIEYEKEDIKEYSHLQRASLVSEIENIKKIHAELCIHAKNINHFHSPLPHFSFEKVPSPASFIWGDIEDIKATFITFLIFWSAVFVWLNFNPPAGFMIVTLATGLSVFTAYTPLKPSLLITVFTFSFIFATLMYLFVLPHLHLAWELGIFIFLYSFIFFYLLPPQLTIFFILGLFTLNITNEMYYNFNLFLLILLMFYLFLFLLQIFYYIPFSTKPEYLFLKLKKRFFSFSQILFQRSNFLLQEKDTLPLMLFSWYSKAHLLNTLEKMTLWASKIDLKHFTGTNKQSLNKFIKESGKFAYFLNLLYHHNIKMKDNLLINDLKNADKLFSHSFLNKDLSAEILQKQLSTSLETIDFSIYPRDSIIDFYENISLRKNTWVSFFECQRLISTLDVKSLEQKRF